MSTGLANEGPDRRDSGFLRSQVQSDFEKSFPVAWGFTLHRSQDIES